MVLFGVHDLPIAFRRTVFHNNRVPQWKKQLAYCGAVSGREEDKFAACGFHVGAAGQAPYIQEADLVLVCKKRYWNDLNPAHMDEEALSNYQAKDYHRVYIGEITQVLVRQKQIP